MFFLQKRDEYLLNRVGARQRNLTKNFISKLKIPLPPLDVQQQIIEAIEAEQKAVDECKRLITIFEGKIKDKISEVWGDAPIRSAKINNRQYNYSDKVAARNVDDDFLNAVMEHEKR